MSQTTRDAPLEAIDSAKSIRNVLSHTEIFVEPPLTIAAMPRFSLPAPLTPKLVSIGLPFKTAEKMSKVFLKQAEELKHSSDTIVERTCSKLACIPRPDGSVPLHTLQERVIGAYETKYEATISEWIKETMDLARRRLAAVKSKPAEAPEAPKTAIRKANRQFKSEFLPLFEFAFENDRFPSREDKKHLARISSMSFRQVCVWFQNRRSRQASRIKSNRITSPPKTLEEMKERLSPSAREALSQPLPFMKKLNPDASDHATTVLVQDNNPKLPSPPEIIVLDDAPSPKPNSHAVSLGADGATSPAPSGRATSLEATDDGYEADDCDESTDDDFLGIPVYQLPVVEEPKPLPKTCNPLNPLKTSVHSFPAVYEPSQLTSDPFLIEHHPWMRDPRTNSKQFIDATPEAVEDIMGGFDRMDVDEPDVKTADNRHSRVSMSFGPWSSNASTAASHTSPYSSSAQSSPRIPEADVRGPLEAEVDSSTEDTSETDYVSDTDLGTEAEPVCDQPEEESPAAGPSTAASLKAQVIWDSSAVERGDAWSLESIALHAKPPNATLKWQNLLAVAAQASQ